MKNNVNVKILIGCLMIAGSMSTAAPAKAFYIEMPQFFKDAAQAFNATFNAPKGEVKGEFETAPSVAPTAPAVPISSTEIRPPSVSSAPAPSVSSAPDTCRINGVDQPGGCQQQNQQPGMNLQPQPGSADMSRSDNARNLKDMQRGSRDMQRQVKEFESMAARLEKKGVIISAELKAKIEELKALTQKFSSASPEDIADLDMGDLGQKMRDLEDERQNLQQMDNIMREMKRIEGGVKMFERQTQKLAQQNVAVPQEVTDNLAKVKAAIADIKAGRLDNANDIFDLVQNLDESRGQMEMLARWPQTVKEMDRTVKNLERELKRAKAMTDRLSKRGIDLSSVYSQFEAAVVKMKAIRDEAKSKVQENAQDAFDLIQNDFFGQMDDVMENQQVIMMIGNVGQFQAEFSRGINKAGQQINALKRQKIDTAELEDQLAQMKTAGAEVKELFKIRPLDPDAIIEALNETQNLSQEFYQKVADLTGAEESMPWDNGPQQFKPIEVSPGLNKMMPRQTSNTAGGGNGGGQTCNINGVETPGSCQQQ